MVPRRRYLRRSSAWLVGAFALVALLLSSVVGMYGVIAYPVSQRTREIGVRIALGAQPKAVYRLIFSDAVRLTAAGLTGLALSVGAASLIRGVLFGVKPWDGGKLALVAAVLGSGGLLASFVPARNAASVDPVEARRAE